MRKLSSLCAAVLAISGFIGMTAAPAAASEHADATAERTSQRDANAARAQRGKPKLAWNDELARIARDHSEDMARDGYIYHSSDLDKKVDGWELLGENVGVGPDVRSIDEAFMESAPHRRNILDRFTRVGVGVIVADDGSLYLTQIFMRPTSQRAATTTSHRRAVHRRAARATRPSRSRARSSREAAVRRASGVTEEIPGAAAGTMSALSVMTGAYAATQKARA